VPPAAVALARPAAAVALDVVVIARHRVRARWWFFRGERSARVLRGSTCW
jgi:hypothetical protein